MFFFFKQKTAYEMRISDWSSDVCSSDLIDAAQQEIEHPVERAVDMRLGRPLPIMRVRQVEIEALVEAADARARIDAAVIGARGRLAEGAAGAVGHQRGDDRCEGARRPSDRKSTRLNASH